MTNAILRIIEIIAAGGVVSSSLYSLLCLWSAAKFLRAHESGVHSGESFLPPVSVLKPLKGIDPEMYESLRSQCLQDYPFHEVIFGVSDPDDAAIEVVKKMMGEFPPGRILWKVCPEILGANVKVSNLAQMLDLASCEYLIVNDSDIRVEQDYLRRVIAGLADSRVGMVTCLYRGVAGDTLGSQLEALGISTDFCSGVLAAQELEGGIRFGLGSTLAFRRADLKKIGGLESILDYLADDYELGKRIAEIGLEVRLSDVVVETFLPSYGLSDFLRHQLRWARGVRDARAGGYFGLVFTFGIFWALVALAASRGALWSWGALALALVLRFAVGFTVGGKVLRDRQVGKYFWLIPLRDLIQVGVWVASFARHTVIWRGQKFELKNGKLIRIAR
ncbi:MAG: bacteriohopanetetrol glucosamine biosynthesis glycosyltransferase HpnI [Candidatus Sulfotelmatobacter sp.]